MVPFLWTAAMAVGGAATEVLPLSAGGHAALATLLLGVDADARAELACATGAWLAKVIFFRTQIAATAEGARGGLRKSPRPSPPSTQGRAGPGDASLVGVATVALVAVGLAVRDHMPAWGYEPTLVGASLLVTALALASTLWAPQGDREAPTPWAVLLVGAVQGVATLPGLSGPALVLASLVWLGVRRERAFELCFLLVIPGEAVLLLARSLGPAARGSLASSGGAVEITRFVLVMALAAVVGGGCLQALRAAVERRLLPLFSLYLVPLAVATMAWAYARP